MENQKYKSIDIDLFKSSEASFLKALDDAGIEHSRVHLYSTEPQMSGIRESIVALADAMPWNALAKVIVRWIEAKEKREVIIVSEPGKYFHAKGYSEKEVEKLLISSKKITVIDAHKEEIES